MTFTGVSGKPPFSVHLQTGKDERTTLTCDPAHHRLALDRTRSGQTAFHRDFPARHEAPLRIADDSVSLRLLLDTSSIEVFAQNGETVLTEIIFPTAGPRSLRIASEGDAPNVKDIAIHALRQ